MNFLNDGNPDGAIISFRKAIEKDRSYFEARYMLAVAYHKAGRLDTAEKEFLKVLYLNPSFKEARLSLSTVYVDTGRGDAALKHILRYIEDVKTNPRAYEVAASAFALKKEYLRAEEMVKKSLSIAPLRVNAKVLLAAIYLDDNNVRQAESLVSEILGIDPRNSEALRLMDRIRAMNNNH